MVGGLRGEMRAVFWDYWRAQATEARRARFPIPPIPPDVEVQRTALRRVLMGGRRDGDWELWTGHISSWWVSHLTGHYI